MPIGRIHLAFGRTHRRGWVAPRIATLDLRYKEKLNATVDGWDEIGTDTSDTEYIQQMDNELEKLGVGSFDPELCDEYVSCLTVFVDLIHCAFT